MASQLDPRIPLGIEPISFVPDRPQPTAAGTAALNRERRDAATQKAIQDIWAQNASDPRKAIELMRAVDPKAAYEIENELEQTSVRHFQSLREENEAELSKYKARDEMLKTIITGDYDKGALINGLASATDETQFQAMKQDTLTKGGPNVALILDLVPSLEHAKKMSVNAQGRMTDATTRAGQQMSADTALAGQQTSAATQARGQDLSAATQERGQNIDAATQRRGQDLNHQEANARLAFDKTKPTAAENKPSNGQEKKALNFFNRAKGAAEEIDSLETKVAAMGYFDQERMKRAPNFAQTQVGQSYNAAQRAFTEARLRKDSGAAIPEHEYDNDKQTYFAQPGDSQTTLKQKARMRAGLLASLAFESGRALGEFYGDDAAEMIGGYKAKSSGQAATGGGGQVPDLTGLTKGKGAKFTTGPFAGQTWIVGPDGKPKQVR